MKKLALIAIAVVAAACQPDTRNNDRRIDEMAKDLKDIKQMLQRGGAGAAAPRPVRPEPDASKTYAMAVDGDPSEGPADAKVTIVKAYDYACPFCERVRDTMDDLKKKYGNDIRIVYKQLVVHPPRATVGALAACAADKQGKFLEMDRILWDKGFKAGQFDQDAKGDDGKPQRCWENAAGCPVTLGFAKEAGINVDKLKADMKSPECQALIAKDQKDLQSLGVGGTPAFFINGRYLAGAQPIDRFTTVIDEELKKANDHIAAGTPAASYYQQVVLDKGLKQLERPAGQ